MLKLDSNWKKTPTTDLLPYWSEETRFFVEVFRMKTKKVSFAVYGPADCTNLGEFATYITGEFVRTKPTDMCNQERWARQVGELQQWYDTLLKFNPTVGLPAIFLTVAQAMAPKISSRPVMPSPICSPLVPKGTTLTITPAKITGPTIATRNASSFPSTANRIRKFVEEYVDGSAAAYKHLAEVIGVCRKTVIAASKPEFHTNRSAEMDARFGALARWFEDQDTRAAQSTIVAAGYNCIPPRMHTSKKILSLKCETALGRSIVRYLKDDTRGYPNSLETVREEFGASYGMVRSILDATDDRDNENAARRDLAEKLEAYHAARLARKRSAGDLDEEPCTPAVSVRVTPAKSAEPVRVPEAEPVVCSDDARVAVIEERNKLGDLRGRMGQAGMSQHPKYKEVDERIDSLTAKLAEIDKCRLDLEKEATRALLLAEASDLLA